ncbi:hypothetical protein BLNAU_12261 [Blattamonas nauphoetae]|uniref:F-box domain-containing protein n=1 Tax=Blattamonas nauphoetae TaxID=2049346 RepID=A0ABQ9XK39_9EUKA|nr:hypothetical protein BLNAU_12261 [Blattamonas nauphoetae]
MAKDPSTFNVRGGLLGLGQDVLLDIIHEMRSLRDLQTFLGSCNQTFDLTGHPRFLWSTETAAADVTGTKALIVKRAPNVTAILNPKPDQIHQDDITTTVFDITRATDVTDTESRRILSMGVIHKNIRLDSNSSYFAYGIIYIDGKNRLHKQAISLTGAQADKHAAKTQSWIDSIELPPANEKYVRIKTQGAFTIIQTERGQLWFRGMTENGTWEESEVFKTFAPFDDESGLVPSSLGPSRVRSFYFEDLRQHYILENGAVFLTGCRQDFLSHPEAGQMAGDGLLELTDSARFRPKYVAALRGEVAETVGDFGLFGVFKPVKYFRRMRTFLMADGTVFARTYEAPEKSDSFLFTPLDRGKFFGGEKIVSMAHFVRDVYVTESGRVLVFQGERSIAAYPGDLGRPKFVHQLPFPVSRLKEVLLPTEDSMVYYKDDGRFYFVGNAKAGEQEETVDVSENVVKYSADTTFPQGMLTKHYCHCGMQYFFLFE